MKPYYDHDGITIYHGDCLEIILELEPVELVLTDPPYGSTACSWDKIIPIKPMWKGLNRIIKINGVVLLFSSQPLTTKLITGNFDNFRYNWIWNKVNGANFMNLKNRPFKTHEEVLVFSKTAKFTFNPVRTKRTIKSLSRDPGLTKRNQRPNQRPRKIEHYNAHLKEDVLILAEDGKKHPVDIIKFSIHEKGRYLFKHPTKKPIKLMSYFIQTYSNVNDLILDFAMGSGTTLVAAKELGRKAIGIEIEEKYCEIAARRLAQGVLPFGSNQSLETDGQKDGHRSA